MQVCSECGKGNRPMGPFGDKGRSWPLLCAPCKIRLVFADPKRVAAMESDIRRGLLAVMETDPQTH